MSSPLPATVVGLDTETTSLDPATGDIIEVAAVKYSLSLDRERAGVRVLQGKEVGDFTRLCKPSQSLTAQITAITGITNDMVKDAPPFSDLVGQLKGFIGRAVIFAHNASFDLKFLEHHGLNLSENRVWDTFALAGAAWPTAQSYNLGQLAQMLGIEVTGEHRAADDVRLTWQLLQKIYRQLSVSPRTHARITELLKGSRQEHYAALFTATPSPLPPLVGSVLPLPAKAADGGVTNAIADIIEHKNIGLIETLPGMPPDNLIGLLKEAGGIISTGTNLQNDIAAKFNLPSLKGRRHYLCASRLQKALEAGKHSPADAWLLIKILVWLEQSRTSPAPHVVRGDLTELNTSHQSPRLLRHLNAENVSCRAICTARSPAAPGSQHLAQCPYHATLQLAQKAKTIVINHELLLDLPNLKLKAPSNLVILQADQLESAVRGATRVDLSLNRALEIAAIFVHLTKHQAAAKLLLNEYQALLVSLNKFHRQHTTDTNLHLTPRVRRNTSWQKVSRAAEQVQGHLKLLTGLLASKKNESSSAQKLHRLAEAQAADFSLDLDRYIKGSSERIQWLELPPADEIILQDIALNLRPYLTRVFTESNSTSLLSSNLTTEGNYSYIKTRLGIENAVEKKIAESSSLPTSMLIYIIDDSPDPASSEFQNLVNKAIINLSQITFGRTLGIFNSQESVRQAYLGAIKGLNKDKISILAQKMTGGRHNMISKFKANPRSFLLGTHDFFARTQIPIENLYCLLISKLPFGFPGHPIIEALATAEGRNPFQDFVLPQTILKLRHDMNRLTSTRYTNQPESKENKSGTEYRRAVVILDRRLATANYSKNFLASLPKATIKIGGYQELIPTLNDWFGPDQITSWSRK